MWRGFKSIITASTDPQNMTWMLKAPSASRPPFRPASIPPTRSGSYLQKKSQTVFFSQKLYIHCVFVVNTVQCFTVRGACGTNSRCHAKRGDSRCRLLFSSPLRRRSAPPGGLWLTAGDRAATFCQWQSCTAGRIISQGVQNKVSSWSTSYILTSGCTLTLR